MKKISGVILVFASIVGIVLSLGYKDKVFAATDACVVTPATVTMSQSSTSDFVVTTTETSSSEDYIYIAAKNYTASGVYSDLATGKVIPSGKTTLSFKLYAMDNATPGQGSFEVYCTKGCSASGCPSGGVPETLGKTTVSLNITGTNPPAGDDGGGQPGDGGGTQPVPPVTTPPPSTNPSGKVQLTEARDLFSVLFPNSVCPANKKNCRTGFYSGSLALSVMRGVTPPALVLGDVIDIPGRQTAHPRLFNLVDPMSPTDSKLTGEIRAGGDYDTFGDFGSTYYTSGIVYNKDKTIWAASDTNGPKIFLWRNGKRYQINEELSVVQGIIKVGLSQILLTNRDNFDITNEPTLKDSFWDELSKKQREYYSLTPAPSGFPSLPAGNKLILGNDQYILTFSPTTSNPKMTIHSPTESSFVAEQILPGKAGDNGKYGVISVSGADYIYYIRQAGKYSATDPRFYGSQLASIYKFDYATEKVAEVAKDISLAPGFLLAVSAFGANTENPGVVVFSRTSSSNLSKIQVYLLSDLSQGKGVDVMSNSPVWTDRSPTNSASLTAGGITYFYTANNAGDMKVYKLEMGVPSSATTTPPLYNPPSAPGGSLSSSGAVGCPRGTVYQTSAGPLCIDSSSGVTTTTSFNFDPTVLPTPPTPGCFVGGTYNAYTGKKCVDIKQQ
jgi:hypothetical protein